MSKKARLAKIQANMRTTVLVFAIGMIILALGVAGLILNRNSYSSYQKALEAEEVLNVEGEIVSVDQKSRQDDGEDVTVYDVKYRYAVDGKDYSGKRRLYHSVSEGDTLPVSVYRTGEGKYREPAIGTEGEWKATNLYPIIGTALGAALGGMSIAVYVGDLRELKKISGKKQQSSITR